MSTTTTTVCTTTVPSTTVPSTTEEFAAPIALAHQPGRISRHRARTATLAQRGMVTAEYAVGILAAIALALVLLRVFNDNRFFQLLFDQVTKLIGEVGGSVAKGR